MSTGWQRRLWGVRPTGKGKMATGDGISYGIEENGKSAGASTLNGKRVGQLQLIVSVRDHERQVNSKKKEGKRESAVYTGALMTFYILCGEVTHMKFMEWWRYSDIKMWQSEGKEILETNGSIRWRVSSAVLVWFQQNHAQKSRMGVAMCFMLTTISTGNSTTHYTMQISQKLGEDWLTVSTKSWRSLRRTVCLGLPPI